MKITKRYTTYNLQTKLIGWLLRLELKSCVMKKLKLGFLFLLTLIICTCRKDKNPNVPDNQFKITSEELVDNLLFVDVNNYQIKTSEPATFSSTDPFIQISSEGLIKRLTSGEVVAIDIVSKANPNNKARTYALGVKDDNYDPTNIFLTARQVQTLMDLIVRVGKPFVNCQLPQKLLQ